MKRKTARLASCLALGIIVAMGPVLELEAQRRGGGSRGGRSARSGSSVNRGGSARSGSTRQQPTRATQTPARSTRPSNQPSAGRGNRPATGNRVTPRRRPTTGTRGRYSHGRRVHSSARWRGGRWPHHRYRHHRYHYNSYWAARFFVGAVLFISIANSSQSTTTVVYSTTYVHYNPWYRPVMYEGEEGHMLTTPPVGYQTDALPEGGETVTFEGQTYTYADWAFWRPSGGGYVVVVPPVGAQVSSIADDAVAHEAEGEATLHQFDRSYYSETTDDAGKTVYIVQPPPPAEELESIPAGSPSFVADGETYYYVNFSLYVAYDEDGDTGFINGEPDLGAQVSTLPEGSTEIENEGKTYYQFDMVFFEQVQDESGDPFYEVIDAPGGDEVTELQ